MSLGGHQESLATLWRLDNLVHMWMRGARMKTRAYKIGGHPLQYGRANKPKQGGVDAIYAWKMCRSFFLFPASYSPSR